MVALSVVSVKACKPISSFMDNPKPISAQDSILSYPIPNSTAKTIILIADNNGTEIFDLLAPFHILKAATNANVFIVSNSASQIPLHRGLSILPHHTFKSFDELDIQPDAIVIPNLSSIVPEHINTDIIDFIKSYYTDETLILSVCDGAATTAQTGLFDGREMIAHASDIPYLKKEFPAVDWIKDLRFVISDNLISTSGVSNATDGTLVLIEKLYDKNTALNAMQKINYPSNNILDSHQSSPITFGDKLTILSKVIIRKNETIGISIENDVSEFELAAILDTYSRTFPKCISTFSENSSPVKSKYGLTLIPTASITKFDKLLCFNCVNVELAGLEFDKLKNIELNSKKYIFDQLLNEYIKKEHSSSFTNVVAKLLDYNYNLNNL